ncbi:hydrolase, haloacid dehalogenase family [Lactobacillus selangorensis]|uniref:Acid sugar phosphatase n=1 Tax=Lactobacillus selangorensis TaxID=81857 RepID=A0A0R2G343_9LACO|nr:TIGR01457 family HAD-type hydrolase [Lactobacillus selangorensis]KRN27487.1 hydrolase, haloacid dehalogenase family [Lactobacillus selangorensis]KRN31316.1 hydrolase, haloacid dehalogenase family [Lactobacillus selangorensis]
MKQYKGYFIDLDGTIYKGSERIPAAKRFIDRLQAAQIPFLFVTNNTTRSPQQVVNNLADNHDIHVSADQVYTPSLATASYLLAENGGTANGKTVYIIGEVGLKSALLDAGFKMNVEHPDYTIVGLDYDATYHKFETATLAIRSGSRFIGTNADKNLPNERGLVPGAGSVIAMVESAVQQKAFYIGKPEKIIMEEALKKIGLSHDEVLMVGDNYQTDIQAGINSDIDTLLVYTGVSTPEQVAQKPIQPTYHVSGLDEWDV